MAHLTHLLCSLCVILLSGDTVSSVEDLQKRIIGGHECERDYHVRLRGVGASGYSSLCGGSLISHQWILTAAHCLKPGMTLFANVSVDPGGPAQEVNITAEPVIYTDDKLKSHDLMLLQLPVTSGIQPVARADCEDHPKIFEIAGHAATTGDPEDKRKSGTSPTLHCANIDVVDCEDLKNTLQEKFPDAYKVKEYQRWLCGQTPGKDICFGDSGGGAVHRGKIYGVISFLGDPDHVCRKACAFMDLCNKEYADWISKIIN